MGYLPNHPPGTWKFFDPNTQKVFKSRDVTWLEKSYGKYLDNMNAPNLPITVPDSDEDLEEEISIGSLSTRDQIETTDNVVDLTPTEFQEHGETLSPVQDPTPSNLPEPSNQTETSTYTPPRTRSKTREQTGMTTRSSVTPSNISATITRSINNMTNRLN